MLTLLGLVILFGTIITLSFFCVPLIISTVVTGTALLILSLFNLLSWWALAPLWLAFLAFAVIFNWLPLRRYLLTPWILRKYHSLLPTMSETERVAAETGDVWWEGELFKGKPNWQKLFAMPKPQLTAEEQAFLENQVETLCDMLNDWEIVNEDRDLPPKVWEYLKQEGFFGLVINREYGGKGFSAIAHSAIVMKIATRSLTAAISVMVPNSVGPGELIHHYGTQEQKQYYLPRLASSQEIPCFALTGPEAGSDATAMLDRGVICKDMHNGNEVLGIRLNFDKRYITLAPIATVAALAVTLYDPDHLLGQKEDLGITLCLVPTNHPGVETGDRHAPINTALLNGPIRGKDVFIPLDWIIGGAASVGKGWFMLMESLSVGRGISLPALSTAVGKLSLRMTSAYANVRKQFKMSIGKIEGIQEALARIGGFTYICEATRILTTGAVMQGVKPALASAIAKYHLTELSRKIINDAMDIHGGKSIQLGPTNYLGLLYGAIPINITVEGANILTRNLIIFGQGALRCHPFVQREIAAVKDEDRKRGLINFDKLIFAHVGYTISNLTRTIIYGLTNGKFIKAPKLKAVAKYCRQLTRMSAALALMADESMLVLGGDLKRKERLSARLGDVLSYLYLGSAVLHYYRLQGQPTSDVPWVTWALEWCLANIQQAFDELLANFPHRWLACIMHALIFPYGRSYRLPLDQLGAQVAEAMLQPSELRDRLTEGCYIGKTAADGTGCIELAFDAMIVAEPARLKMQNAIRAGILPKRATFEEQLEHAIKAGILTAEELQLLRNYHTLYKTAIHVDEFKPNTLARKSNYGRRKTQSNTTT